MTMEMTIDVADRAEGQGSLGTRFVPQVRSSRQSDHYSARMSFRFTGGCIGQIAWVLNSTHVGRAR
jgi:hypothetical protein